MVTCMEVFLFPASNNVQSGNVQSQYIFLWFLKNYFMLLDIVVVFFPQPHQGFNFHESSFAVNRGLCFWPLIPYLAYTSQCILPIPQKSKFQIPHIDDLICKTDIDPQKSQTFRVQISQVRFVPGNVSQIFHNSKPRAG